MLYGTFKPEVSKVEHAEYEQECDVQIWEFF